MPIVDLQPKQGKVDLIAEVVEKGDIREFEKFGKKGRVCNAKIKDETGTITLTLWNDDIDQVNLGDKIQIRNGYVGEWQGEKQLSTGKFGTLEKVQDDDIKEDLDGLKNNEKDFQKIDGLEEGLKKEAPLSEELKEIEKEEKELDEIEAGAVMNEPEEEEKEDIITADEIEEAEILEPKKEEPQYEDSLTKDETDDEVVVEEDVVDEEEPKEF